MVLQHCSIAGKTFSKEPNIGLAKSPLRHHIVVIDIVCLKLQVFNKASKFKTLYLIFLSPVITAFILFMMYFPKHIFTLIFSQFFKVL